MIETLLVLLFLFIRLRDILLLVVVGGFFVVLVDFNLSMATILL